MWQRKSPGEWQQQKIMVRKDPIPPLLVGALGALLSLILEPSLFIFLLSFFLFFLLAYLGQLFFGNLFILVSAVTTGGPVDPPNTTVICNSCHHIKTRDNALSCECGGTFEPFENWKWIDDAAV